MISADPPPLIAAGFLKAGRTSAGPVALTATCFKSEERTSAGPSPSTGTSAAGKTTSAGLSPPPATSLAAEGPALVLPFHLLLHLLQAGGPVLVLATDPCLDCSAYANYLMA